MPSNKKMIVQIVTLLAVLLTVVFVVRAETQSLETLLAYLKSPNPSTRREALQSLGMIKDFSALPEMIDALKDPTSDVRRVAIKSLVALYTEHDIEFITNRRAGWNLFNPFLDTSDHEIVEPYIKVDPAIVTAIGESARGDR